MKNLVIVESPAKAKTLEKFLGSDFKVMACGGHVRDLPPKKLGVNVDRHFEPTYQTIKGKEKILKTLADAAAKVKMIYLAPDPDREGEAIAWHLTAYLGTDGRIKRIEFNEITQKAVLEAIKAPRSIDMNRVNAQQARRILDRLVGYKLSPLLWKKVRRGLSAGRVQSVAVRLICEREKEILAFHSEEYWSITALLTPKTKESPFSARLDLKAGQKLKIGNENESREILTRLEKETFAVKEIIRKEQRRHPYAPFITSTLQQDAGRKLGYTAKRTMMTAQHLYEGVNLKDEGMTGLITYMRTDSTRIAGEAIAETRSFIERNFGKSYLPASPRVYKKKKQAQDAHEAIRPTSVFHTPESVKNSLTAEQYKLYTLIWQRFVASQMESAVLDNTAVDISAGEYGFRATGQVVKFDGFLTLYEESRDEEEEKEGILPPLTEGENLKLIELKPAQHFTQPPPRFNEASLVKVLEEKGIGRPSTYAPIVATIQERGYIIKEGRQLRPTELGMLTNEQLTQHFPNILDIKFTARMEDNLDKIVAGKIDWIKVLDEFYWPFEKTLSLAEKEMKSLKVDKPTTEICERCGRPMVIKQGRYGEFLACSGFPECKNTRELPPPPGTEKKEPTEKCEKCGRPMVVKRSRYGEFLACSGYPQCKNIKPILKGLNLKCPRPGCGGEVVERKSKRGKLFWGCSNYPKCTFATWNKPIAENCPKCGYLLTEARLKGQGVVKKCSNPECDYVGEAKKLTQNG